MRSLLTLSERGILWFSTLRRWRWVSVLLLMGVVGAGGAGATTATWTGNTSTAWGTGTNWLGGTAPNNSGDEADISGTPSRTTMAQGATAITLGNITFNTTSALTMSGTGGLTFQNSTSGATGITLSNSGTLKISAGITLDDDFYVVNNGSAATTLTFSGGVATSATSNITLSGTGSTAFTSNAITGAGSLTVSGSGSVTVSTASTYTGNTTVNGGSFEAAATLTTPNVFVNGGNFDYTGNNRLADTTDVTVAGGNYNLATFKDTIDDLALVGGNVTGSGTLTSGNFDLESGTMSAGLAGTANVTKSTAGTVTLSGSGTFSGVVTVDDGTLELSATSGSGVLAKVSSVVINSGGTLLLGASDQINGGALTAVTANMTLAGGTFDTWGFNQSSKTLGTLTLSATSTINLGTGASVIHFDVSSGQGWGAGSELVVLGWNGTIAGSGGGTDELFFGTSTAGLTSGQVNQIVFVNPNGVAGNYSAEILSSGEVIAFKPIPEPETYAAGGVLALVAGWWEWRRRRTGG